MTMRITDENLDQLPAGMRAQVERQYAKATAGQGRLGRPEQKAGRILIRYVDALIIPAPWDSSVEICVGDYFAHNANGGARTPTEGAILKGQGVRKGWPDYTLYLAIGGYHGLVLELKADDGAKPDAEQLEIMARLERAGWAAAVAWGGEDAIDAIDRYVARRA